MGKKNSIELAQKVDKVAVSNAETRNSLSEGPKPDDVERGARVKQLLRESAMCSLPPTSDSADCGTGAKRVFRRYTQKELAELCGYSETQFSRIIKGRTPMHRDLSISIIHEINRINGVPDDSPDAIAWEWLDGLLPDHLKYNRDIRQRDETVKRITNQYAAAVQAYNNRVHWEQIIFAIIEEAADGLGLSAGHTRSGDGPNGETLFVLVDSEDQNKVLVASDLEGFRDALVQQAELLLSGMLVRQQRGERQKKKDAKRKTTPQLCNVASKPNGGATHE